MEDQVLQIVRNALPQLLQESLGSFSNTVVPWHVHNGIGSPRISANNLNTDSGLYFPSFQGTSQANAITTYAATPYAQYQITYCNHNGNNASASLDVNAISQTGMETLNIGNNGYPFKNITLFATNEVSIAPVIALPDITLPLSPVAGQIAFHSGGFYGCEVSGTWKQFTLT